MAVPETRRRRSRKVAAFATVLLSGTALLGSAALAQGTSSDGVGDRLVVTFRDGRPAGSVEAALRGAGASEHSAIPRLAAHVVTTPSGHGAAALAALRANPDVRSVEVDGTAAPTATPNDPYFPTGAGSLNGGEWGSAKTQAPQAWDLTTGSPSVTIAVIDSGVVASQPDLAPVLVPGWNVLTNTSDTADTYGHGTEVAGVAVAATNNAQGVAAYCWSCGLMPVKVYNSASAYNSDIASGMTWAVDHGAKVLTISLAGTTSSSVLADATAYALSHGAVVVAAAGNNGNSTPTYPASLPGVISVAATDQADTLTSYSDYGSWVDVAAPGSTPTTLPNGAYGAIGGTSIATPAVAGIAGLILSASPAATPSAVANALFTSADSAFPAGSTAYGRVNAFKALQAAAAPAPPPAPAPAPANTTAPAISGTARSGQTLTASSGSWSGSPTAYAYQWRRCDTAGTTCTDIPGATTTTYALGSADVGATMVVRVTASNATGSTAASSPATAAVAAGMMTTTFSGSLGKATSQSFTLNVGAGATSSAVSFSKCASLALAVKSSSGTMVAQTSGPSVLSLSTSLAAGTSTWVVSGSCRVPFTLSVTAPAP